MLIINFGSNESNRWNRNKKKERNKDKKEESGGGGVQSNLELALSISLKQRGLPESKNLAVELDV